MSLILSGTDGLSDVDGTAATPAIRGTDANTGIFFPAADTIAFSEGGAEIMRIDSSGNVGIGTASPANAGSGSTVLDISSGSAQSANLWIHSNNTSGTSAGFQIQVASNLETYFWNYANSTIYFATNSTERARIPAAGGIQSATTISVGNATPSTSGAGITFPASQSASTNANTLDDYEEGTWTTTFSSPNNLTGTPVLGGATYTKIGRLVTISGKITGYSVTSSNTLTGPVFDVPFPMAANDMPLSGSSIASMSGVFTCGSVYDNNNLISSDVVILFPAVGIASTGVISIFFTLVYQST